MKIIDLELRIEFEGRVSSWDVYLERVHPNHVVNPPWHSGPNNSFAVKILKRIPVPDNILDVYLACEGNPGARAICTVFINRVKQESRIISQTSKKLGHESYPL